jgi:hypothetical protein
MRERMSRVKALIAERKCDGPPDNPIMDAVELAAMRAVGCVDCGATVFPMPSERGPIRCATHWARRIEHVLGVDQRKLAAD